MYLMALLLIFSILNIIAATIQVVAAKENLNENAMAVIYSINIIVLIISILCLIKPGILVSWVFN